ncbi:LOW QUALITY PROTEIN: TNFAIP3-interacting protein 3 [Artibeus jamaicensis]|uniref:LOW QUALITY PROTEIN: TNFAIP3-interacting protein 3 n=1 Tax=Artibeus jamaicensis TaxID=9417 RepID=UPI00235B2B3B|nr:LOW QUALITY PROTEIN: TNFAIP3-interacting protein 3 [Artibeus jamaicensis]
MAQAQGTTAMGAAEGSTGHMECANSSRGKTSTISLEQKIRYLEKQRKELLEVNQQWDRQFRSMKELYERKVAELRMKLEATEKPLSTLEKGQPPGQRDGGGPEDLAQEQLQRAQKEKQSLDQELHELKRENKLLREKNTAVHRKKEHYECEIKRLNQALRNALKIEGASFPEHRLRESEKGCSLEEMRTEMEVLKQQVQIYEEDFNRERSDRERLNQEKEVLQQSNQTCQSQVNKLKSKLKACQMEKEKLERQLKQVYLPTCRCGFGVHLQDLSAPAGPEAVQDLERHPISPPKRKSPSKPCARAEGCAGAGSTRPGPRSSGPCGSCLRSGCVSSAPPPCAVPFGVDGGKGL